VRAVIIDGLILLQQFDAAIDPLAHGACRDGFGNGPARLSWRDITER
jgi:hypothetical protein